MKNMAARLRRVTRDLKAIQEELGHAATQASASGHGHVLDSIVTIELVTDLKTSVDHMRTFLWSYIESASRQTGVDVDYTLQTTRMKRVTEMLRVLRGHVDQPRLVEAPEAHGFFEEVSRIATLAVDRHLADINSRSASAPK